MSAHTSPLPVEAPEAVVAPASSAEIDASCRVPLLLLFVHAAVWLVIGSVFALIATLKFHNPNILADCPWLTYGRVHPAHLNSFLYGFAAQAGVGVLLWLMCHLSRARLASAHAVALGAVVWNLGVLLGICGILYGENTGFEWLEMPRYASLMLFFSYLLMGFAALCTFHQRRPGQAYLSLWYLFAAVFWFPWIYATANFLLVARPVRGVVQAIVDGWYITNFTNVWLGCIGLGALFYFIPKILNRPLHSHYLGIFGFWTLVWFGSWGGVATGAPVPAWLPALSTVAGVLLLVAVLSVAWNLQRTLAGSFPQLKASLPVKFMAFGAVAYVVGGLLISITSSRRVSVLTHFTWFEPAQSQLLLYGFFAMTMFGALYYIVPRLLGAELSGRLVKVHFWCATAGILLYVVPLAAGGIKQGVELNLGLTPVLTVTQSTLMFLRVSTMGDLLMALGHFVLLLNLGGVLVRLTRACVRSKLTEAAATAEVTA